MAFFIIKGRLRYTFESKCLEESAVDLDDNMHKIVYNAKGYENEGAEKLRAFMKYVSSLEPSDDFTERLTTRVEKIKLDEKFQKEYMAVNIREHELFNEGKAEGIKEGKAEGLLEGKIEGKIEGVKQKQLDIVHNMLSMDYDRSEICKITGVSFEELDEIEKELKK